MVLSTATVALLVGGLAGGAFGAAVGGRPALSLAGVAVVLGEVTNAAGVEVTAVPTPAPIGAAGLTGAVGYGPVLGPHVAFAGGVAAAAYAGRKRTIDAGFRYHQAKQVAAPLWDSPGALLVGAAFGLLGAVVARLAAAGGVPADPVMLAVVVSAALHRLAFGYPLLGTVREGILDMSPYERGDVRGEAGGRNTDGRAGRHVVEPWQPDYYGLPAVVVLGGGVGLAAAVLALLTGSAFLAFGLAAASLGLLDLGSYPVPVTHHVALPASIVALAAPFGTLPALLGGVAFGVAGGLVGELAQRLLYAHGDTHFDPPAVSIVVTSLLVAALVAVGLLDPGPVPYPA